ncbi:GTP-binding protein, partial [bacterium]|nr:GTP-binding protein [bacterium]
MKSPEKILNLGILASVDAGKTTITENMLFLSGITRQLGQVDKGTTVTDSLPLERQRGISIKAAITAFDWRDCQINLIDTPGHMDFTAEVERALSI